MASSFVDSMGALKKAAKTGDPDLKLSKEVRDAYINAVREFRDTLQKQLGDIEKLSAFGDAGWFVSAHQTRTNLEIARDELKRDIGDYIKYLDEFAETVKVAAERLIKSG